jgi:type IV pilus assembly protein PilQ
MYVNRGPVAKVHVTTTGQNPQNSLTRVVVDLLRPASYRVIPPEDGGREFKVVFEDTDRADASAAGAGPVFVASIGTNQPEPGRPLDPIQALMVSPASGAPVAPTVDMPLRPLAPAGTPVRAPIAQQAAGGATQQPLPPPAPGTQSIGGQQRVFTGHPVNLDFQGADLRAVLRTFAEISGLNIVIDPAVQGSVDVALREVPWDQALDIILRANKLGYVIDGTIVRIAPLNVLSDEEAQRRKLADEQALSGELTVLTRPLSYAKAADLVPLLTNTALSARGDIQIDTRTNTIIIRDLANRLQTAVELINSLDRAQPQVEIEARIVQTTREFIKNLGVQWGFNGLVSQALANTTGLAFPNQGSLTGRIGGTQGAIQGAQIDHTQTAVNLGVEGASSAIGLALGSINGAVNLDVALSALERSGQGRLLSTPRVTTQNNVAAEITQGVQIPIQTVANNTVTVSFKDAALTLRVVPQITAANTVIMQITLDNSAPDYSRAILGIPPIDTQRAITQVLVSDGQTTVIGGIYVSQEQAQSNHTPGLHRLPLLGYLFRRQSTEDQSRELLIFITPRIIKT